MCCVCPRKICMLIICIALVVIVIGFLFGFGVFKHGFHKIKHKFDVSEPYGTGIYGNSHNHGRPFFNYSSSPPF